MWKEKQRKRASDLRRKYGMTPVEFTILAAAQDNRCAICSSHMKDSGGLVVDHCHETKKVRGLLCRKCNGAIGMLKDSPRILTKALLYLVDHMGTT